MSSLIKQHCGKLYKEVKSILDIHTICDYIWETFCSYNISRKQLDQRPFFHDSNYFYSFQSNQYEEVIWKLYVHYSKVIIASKKGLIRACYMILWKMKNSLECFASWNFSRALDSWMLNWMKGEKLVCLPKDRGKIKFNLNLTSFF